MLIIIIIIIIIIVIIIIIIIILYVSINNIDDNGIQRGKFRFFYNVLTAPRTVSNT